MAQSRQTAKTGQTRVARIERPSLFDGFFATREESKSETENGNFNSLENGPEKVTVIRLSLHYGRRDHHVHDAQGSATCEPPPFPDWRPPFRHGLQPAAELRAHAVGALHGARRRAPDAELRQAVPF